MTTTANPATDRYLLGDSPGHIEHLTAQAAVYRVEAEELLDRIGLAEGWRALDVGCGVLGILQLLAARVGKKGQVVGLDREPRILELARLFANEHDLDIELVQADAIATGLPSESFDLVHARTLLLNVAQPAAVLTEMVRLSRPGGIVAVQEPDAAAWTCDPPHPGFDIIKAAIVNAYLRDGKDFNVGRRTARLLRDAGLEDIRVRATARVTRSGEYYQTFVLTLASLVRDEIQASGELTLDQLDNYSAQLRHHLEASNTITIQPVIWQAWGTKPATSH